MFSPMKGRNRLIDLPNRPLTLKDLIISGSLNIEDESKMEEESCDVNEFDKRELGPNVPKERL